MNNKNKFIWTTKVSNKGQIVIPKEAREIFNDADFYYDDATHIYVDMSENDNINFWVGKDDCYYAKLGTIINQYKLEYNGDVYLLVKV